MCKIKSSHLWKQKAKTTYLMVNESLCYEAAIINMHDERKFITPLELEFFHTSQHTLQHDMKNLLCYKEADLYLRRARNMQIENVTLILALSFKESPQVVDHP
jgi:hypothetical protein